MKLALLGSGRMGTEVERQALAAGHEIASKVGRGSNLSEALAGADVAIDFTSAGAVLEHIRASVDASVPIVVGTTGWHEHLGEARRAIEQGSGALVHGANFSVGAHLFMKLVDTAARLFDPFEEYDPYVLERHHRGKKDAPSGTARALADTLVARMGRKTTVRAGNPEGAIAPEAVHVASVRAGAAFGIHEVSFDSAADEVTLTHSAHGREGFARGAIYAAEWIRDKKGFYEFSSILPWSEP